MHTFITYINNVRRPLYNVQMVCYIHFDIMLPTYTLYVPSISIQTLNMSGQSKLHIFNIT